MIFVSWQDCMRKAITWIVYRGRHLHILMWSPTVRLKWRRVSNATFHWFYYNLIAWGLMRNDSFPISSVDFAHLSFKSLLANRSSRICWKCRCLRFRPINLHEFNLVFESLFDHRFLHMVLLNDCLCSLQCTHSHEVFFCGWHRLDRSCSSWHVMVVKNSVLQIRHSSVIQRVHTSNGVLTNSVARFIPFNL